MLDLSDYLNYLFPTYSKHHFSPPVITHLPSGLINPLVAPQFPLSLATGFKVFLFHRMTPS